MIVHQTLPYCKMYHPWLKSGQLVESLTRLVTPIYGDLLARLDTLACQPCHSGNRHAPCDFKRRPLAPTPVAHVASTLDRHGPELPWPQARHGAFTPPHDRDSDGWQEVHHAPEPVGDGQRGTRRMVDHLADNPTWEKIIECDQLSSEDEDPEADDRMLRVMTQPSRVDENEWHKVGQCPLAEDAVASVRLVREFAMRQSMAFLKSCMTVAAMNEGLQVAVEGFRPTVQRMVNGVETSMPRGDNGYANRWLRVPPTKEVCDRIIGVQPPQRYELHVC